ncbi:MAG: methylated-DNA--[protein]-cysteine S-methyltransferase [Christensenellales bacterium]|jgi:methylated-DNA-[protein]-cysteine S-methyltransferase
MHKIRLLETAFGPVGIAERDGAITHVYFGDSVKPDAAQAEETTLLLEAEKQLSEYLDGTRRQFELPFAPEGTSFEKRVWRALEEIPYGQTATYGQIAQKIGSPNASRAVGRACGRNPIGIMMPCHRVLGASGKLTGYAGGLDMKRSLLDLERKMSAEV